MVAFWLLLSGHYNPLMLFFMVISVALVVWLSFRMHSARYQIDPVSQGFRIVRYIAWLIIEIFKASIDVSLRVWGFKPIEPAIKRIPAPQKTELGKTFYANSITLTPGTVTIGYDKDRNELIVHAIHKELFEDLESGVMGQKVRYVEGD